jgi:5-methyltetrahydrofolate--homocysteine methyltransferase
VLIVGERINCTRKRIGQAARERDAEFIKNEAIRQVEAGAQLLDVNGGIASQEVELLPWLVGVVQEVVDVPLCLDSADPEALSAALPLCRKRPMINSITDEPERKSAILPLIKQFGTQAIALCLSPSGPPSSLEDRVGTAGRLVDFLTSEGLAPEDIYVDACIFPLSVGAHHTVAMLQAVDHLASRYPGIHISCGLSNVSHGLPVRRLLNEVFLMMLMGRGLDAAIVDPTDFHLMACIRAAEALLGRDEFCADYLRAYRSGKLEPQAAE